MTSTTSVSLTTTTYTTTTTVPPCTADEVEVFPHTAPGGRLCRTANFSFPSFFPLTMQVQTTAGIASLQLGSIRYAADSTITAGVKLLAGVTNLVTKVASATLQIEAAAHGTVANALLPAGESVGVLRWSTSTSVADPLASTVLDGGVYADDTSIRLSLQMWDTTQFSRHTTDTSLIVVVSPSSSVAEWEQRTVAPYMRQTTCTSIITGICHLEVVLPNEFYEALGDGEQLTVQYTLLDDKEFTLLDDDVGTIVAEDILLNSHSLVEVGRIPSWYTTVLNNDAAVAPTHFETIYTTLPTKDLYPNDVFTVEVRSRFTVSLKTMEIRAIAGEGLRFIGDIAASVGGKDVFFGTMDREARLISASLARKTSTPLDGSKGIPTDELLFSIRVRVEANAAVGFDGNSILLEGIRFKDGNEALLSPNAAGLIISRHGVTVDAAASVAVRNDVLMSAMAYTTGPSELFNTAMLNGVQIVAPVKIVGVLIKGGEVDITNTCSCSSSNHNTLQVTIGGCVAFMDGSEREAAREVVITATCQHGMHAKLSFRTHIPTDVALTAIGVVNNQIRPIAGWMVDRNGSCTQPRYQDARVVATASFSNGQAKRFADFDVTGIITLASSTTGVLTIDTSATAAASGDGILLRAVAPGTTTLRVHTPKGAVVASLVVEVMDASRANQLAVVGIDVHAVHALGSVAYTTGSSAVGRGDVVQVTISPPTAIQLQYEGDSMAIMACTSRVLRQKCALEYAIGSHACSLEASMRAANSIHLGCSRLLPLPL
jgi:hypothetical protein